MPIYAFVSLDQPEKSTDMYFSIKSCPKVGDIITDDEGKKWKRVWGDARVNAMVNLPLDPDNNVHFIEKTGKMKGGTVGDMWDLSEEMSRKRAERAEDGKDPVKKDYFRRYSASRKGTPHMKQLAEQQRELTKKTTAKMKELGISISTT